MNQRSSSVRKVDSANRLAWLRARPELWSDWQLEEVAVHPSRSVNKERHRRIADEMKRAGVVAASTYWIDVGVDSMVRTLRSETRNSETTKGASTHQPKGFGSLRHQPTAHKAALAQHGNHQQQKPATRDLWQLSASTARRAAKRY